MNKNQWLEDVFFLGRPPDRCELLAEGNKFYGQEFPDRINLRGSEGVQSAQIRCFQILAASESLNITGSGEV